MNKHGPALPDLLRPGLDLAICGTAAGRKSAEVGAYYAGPGNKFWRVLNETGLTPRQLAPWEFKMLPEYGIGLTDLAKHYAGSDAGLRAGDYDVAGCRRKIEAAQPRILAFNGKTAAKEFLCTSTVDYGHHPDHIGDTELFVLPSTSGAAARWWDKGIWHDLGHRVQELRDA